MKHGNMVVLALSLLFAAFVFGCGSGGQADADGDLSASDGDESEAGEDQENDGDAEADPDKPADGDDADGDDADGDGDDDGDDGEPPDYTDCVALYGEGWAFNPSATSGDGCKDCTTKECPEESSVGIYRLTTELGRCVCETKEGYFFSDTTFLPMPCDKDGDGWTTITAREFMEGADTALRDNARCDLRLISEFVLVPEEDRYSPIAVPADGIPLYEPNNRDDQDLLDTDQTRAPAYGGGDGRRLTAEELNSLTKACVSANADYNGNGVSDIAEWLGSMGIDEGMLDYASFSYFIELHHGWYDAESSRYFIMENSRQLSSDGPLVPVAYESGGEEYWRECSRRTDASYDPEEPTIGLDFAGFEGMLHHSQFKCVQAVSDLDLDPLQPQKMTVDQIQTTLVLNACQASSGEEPADGDEEEDFDSFDGEEEDSASRAGEEDGDSEEETEEPIIDVPPPDPGIANPVYPELQCEPDDSVVVGDVGFAAAKYVHYENAGDYSLGCVNECVEGWSGISECSGYPDSAGCDTDRDAFGMGACGCIGNYAYPECVDCENHYDLQADCEECLPHWDLATECTTCTGHFSLFGGCTTCLGNWAGANCDACATNWDLATDCTECINHFDARSNCTTCLDNSMSGHWTGAACNQCKGNWDVGADCLACLDEDEGGHWSGASCSTCKTNFYDGNFESGNLVRNPNGENHAQGWTPLTGTNVLQDSNGSGSFIRVMASMPYMANAYQYVDLSDYLAKISGGDYQGLQITISASVWTFEAGTIAQFLLEAQDKAQKPLVNRGYGTNSATPEVLGPYTISDSAILSKVRYLKLTLGGTMGGVANPIVIYGFRSVSVVVSHAPATAAPCRFCEDGWTDNPNADGPDCLSCLNGVADAEHWNNSDTSVCRECWNDNTHGHWEYPSCNVCGLLWSGPTCTSCSTEFAKNTSGECSKTVTLVKNGDAEAGIGEAPDMSGWTSNIPVSRHQSYNNINSAAEGGWFFSFTEADGEKNPYAEQRITISDAYKSLIQSGNIGWLFFSAQMAEHNDSDTPSVEVYQVVTPGSNGTRCANPITTDSKTWSYQSDYCQIASNATEIRLVLKVDNDDGGRANGYFDAVEIHMSAKAGE